MFEIIFWVSAFLIFYTYIGYFLILIILASCIQVKRDIGFLLFKNNRRVRSEHKHWPKISVIIAAYNEEKVIRSKIENSLKLKYPSQLLEVIVASDGSCDKTDRIVESYGDMGVKLVSSQRRLGKPSLLNRTIPIAKGDIVVLSDANTMYSTDVIKKLVRHFEDSNVGVVCGEMRLNSPQKSYKSDEHYWHYEVMLKILENKIGGVLGSNGGIYAIRKSLYQPITENTIVDDFVIPLKIRELGYNIVYDPESIAFEDTAKSIKDDYIRHVRIAAGNFQSIIMLRKLLNPLRGSVSFCFWSHKVLRWLVPFFMVSVAISNMFLLDEKLYLVSFLLQLFFYLSVVLGIFIHGGNYLSKFLNPAYHFVTLNVAMFVGFLKFLRNSQTVVWEKIER